MKKKIFALLLVICMSLSLIGCSNESGSVAKGNNNDTSNMDNYTYTDDDDIYGDNYEEEYDYEDNYQFEDED